MVYSKKKRVSLSVIASITGIRTAAAKVSSILGQVRDTPESMPAVLAEVSHFKDPSLEAVRESSSERDDK
jgi:hypothetical protein